MAVSWSEVLTPINNSSLNFQAQQQCLRSKLSPLSFNERGFP
jgi:hypothetical protein